MGAPRAASRALFRALLPTWNAMGVHRDAEFNKAHVPGFLRGIEPKAWLTVYPFVRSYEWYLLPRRRARPHARRARSQGRRVPRASSPTPSHPSRSATTSGCCRSRPTSSPTSSTSCATCAPPTRAATCARRCRSTPAAASRRPSSSRWCSSGRGEPRLDRRSGDSGAATAAARTADASRAPRHPHRAPPARSCRARRPPRSSGAEHVTEPVAYDAILLAGFGGPEGQDDVIPFLRNVTSGRGIPDERLEEVAHHYRHFGGVSPINEQNRELKAALEAELARRGIDLPVLLGQPQLGPVPQRCARRGEGRRSHEAHRDRDERLQLVLELPPVPRGLRRRARRHRPRRRDPDRQGAPVLRPPRLRRSRSSRACATGSPSSRHPSTASTAPPQVEVLFATHSIPSTDAAKSGPAERGLRRGRRLRGAAPRGRRGRHARGRAHADVPWQLVYQSRSRPAHRMPWLEPDINDAIDELPAARPQGRRDRAARFRERPHGGALGPRQRGARDRGRAGPRAPCACRRPAPHPAYVAGLVDLVLERVNGTPAAERPAVTELGPWYDVCRPGCCENVRLGLPAGARGDRAMTPHGIIRIGTRGSALAMAQTRRSPTGSPRPRRPRSSSCRSRRTATRSRASLADDRRHGRVRRRAPRGAARRRVRRRRALVEGPADRRPPGPAARRRAEARRRPRRALRARRAHARDAARGRAGRHRLAAPHRAARSRPVPTSTSSTSAATSTPGSARSTSGELDAVMLAAAGLGRLGRLDAVTEYLELADWPTAPGQGALAIEVRRERGDRDLERALEAVDHGTTRATVLAERSCSPARGGLLGAGRRDRVHRRRTAVPDGERVQCRRDAADYQLARGHPRQPLGRRSGGRGTRRRRPRRRRTPRQRRRRPCTP